MHIMSISLSIEEEEDEEEADEDNLVVVEHAAFVLVFAVDIEAGIDGNTNDNDVGRDASSCATTATRMRRRFFISFMNCVTVCTMLCYINVEL